MQMMVRTKATQFRVRRDETNMRTTVKYGLFNSRKPEPRIMAPLTVPKIPKAKAIQVPGQISMSHSKITENKQPTMRKPPATIIMMANPVGRGVGSSESYAGGGG
jgi:hypothetical protein